MIGEYYCYHLLRTGAVCGQTCRRPEGCFEHWKAKPRIPCKVCSKPISSKPGLCRKHASGYYVTQYIDRLRDNARVAEMLEEARMLEDAKLLEDARRLEEG
jgi:hypothetical protein